MKIWYLTLLFAIGAIPAIAQTPSDCTPIRAMEKLYDTDAADMALERIFTLRNADTASIEIPQAYKDSAMRELAAVCNLGTQLEADSVFRAYCVHRSAQRRFMPLEFAVQVDTSDAWAKQWFRGNKLTGDAQIDGFLSRHGVEMTHYQFNPSWSPSLNHFATLTATRPVNMKAFADSFMKFRGAVTWYFRPRYGDGSQIRYVKNSRGVELTFIVGWGDCPAGCTSTRTWKYSIDPATCSVDLDTSYFAGAPVAYNRPDCDLIPTGIRQQAAGGITVFPNPADGSLNVRIEHTHAVAYRVLDYSGRLLLGGFITGNSIDVHSLATGMYILQITGESGERFVHPFSKR